MRRFFISLLFFAMTLGAPPQGSWQQIGIQSHLGVAYTTGEIVSDTGTLAGGTLAVTFTNAFSAATAYICTVTDTTTPANAVTVTYTSASVVTFAGTGVDNIKYQCTGH